MGIYGFGFWEMKSMNILHTFYGITLLGICLPMTYHIYNTLWAPADERRARTINPAEKLMVAAGIELMTST
jgi:hypothetical protein